MSTSRSYHSPLRDRQAQQTRLRIRQAARELFERDGFSATTVRAIADHATVSEGTVYAAFESKAGIIRAMLDDLEEAIDIRSRLERVFAEDDPVRQLRDYLSAHCDLFTAGIDILRAAVQAGDSPEVGELTSRGDAHRRAAIEELTRRWHQSDALRPGLTPTAAAERIWLLTTVESFLAAVDRLGWPADRYENWLLHLIMTTILDAVGGDHDRPIQP